MGVPTLRHTRLLILGSGPAGLTAAIYGARALLEPVLVSGFEPGGQLMITTDVENYPGFAETIQGPWLMEQMQRQAERMGAQFCTDHIVRADLSGRPFRLFGDSNIVYSCDSLILATGARARWLNLPSEQKFKGYGVSACATCDGFFYRGKKVCVVGGGNTAVEEALYLAALASHVTLIHRRDHLRAERILQERLFAHPKITCLWNHTVEEILGEEGPPLSVTHVRLRHTQTGVSSDHSTDGVFIAIGHEPASDLFRNQLKMNAHGYITTPQDRSTATSLEGVFAAGDVTDDQYRQAVTAAGMGCMAALEAERWLALHSLPS